MTLMLTAAGIAATFLVGLVTVWINDRMSMRKLVAEGQQKLVDSLQEERQSIKNDLLIVRKQVTGLIMQGRYKDDYINELRSHIEQEKPPPPPRYPAALLHIASEGL